MHLIAWNAAARHLEEGRQLTAEEEIAHKRYVPIFKEAENRLCLFKLLNKNFEEWTRFVRQLISPEDRNFDADYLELHRLLLNYLTTAYTISEHFEVSYRKRYRAKSDKLGEYGKFVDDLCVKSSDYAFISDYRGYVQHVGLGVENYHRNNSQTSVTLTIEVRPSVVVQQSRSWAKSKLTKNSPSIDLVGAIHRYHMVVLDLYAPFVAKTFYPELIEADRFYKKLLEEVQKGDGRVRMFFSPEKIKVKNHGGVVSGTMNWIGVPNDVFGELGIRINLPTLKKAN